MMKYKYVVLAIAVWWLFWIVWLIARRGRAKRSAEPSPPLADYQAPE